MGTRDSYERLFSLVDHREPPGGLLNEVMTQIEAHDRRAARIRSALSGALFVAALVALVPAWHVLSTELAQSGFIQFVSLLFSDAGVLLAFWQDFVISLAESFPVVGAAAVCGSVFVLLFSVRAFVRDIGVAFHRSKCAGAAA